MYPGYLHPFDHGRQFFHGIGEHPRTLVELAMCQLSAELRAHVGWWTSYTDESVRARWAQEAAARVWDIPAPCGPANVILSENQIKYVLDELDGYAALRDKEYDCEVSCFDRIWQAHELLDPDTLASLNAEIQRLPAARSDDGAPSRDLVDPFLHCMVYGRTLVRDQSNPDSLRPEPSPGPAHGVDTYAWSSCFSCIPTSFSITQSDGKLRASALSYINNIDPSHTALYGHIESTLAACIPLFEHALTDLHRDNPLRQRIPGRYVYTRWEEPEEPEHSDDEEGWVAFEREVRQWALHRPLQLPDIPPSGYPGGLETRRFTAALRGSTVKVVVRITEIRIPPGGAYAGTPWHVAGMRNEHIAVCAACCTHTTNAAPPALEFRMAVTAPRAWLSGDAGGTARTWGLAARSPCCQRLGAAPLAPGRALAWPNVYQHRLGPAALRDPAREGRITLLWLALVDPDLDLGAPAPAPGQRAEGAPRTTERVPPQQAAWMRRAVEESLDVRVPVELVEQITELVDGVVSAAEAARHARAMREERARFWAMHDHVHFCIPFDVYGIAQADN